MSLQTSGRRVMVFGGKPIFFKNKKAQAYIDKVASLARQHKPLRALTGAIRLDLTFVLPRPKSLCRKKDSDGLIRHTKRPDRDNLVKGTQDALSLAGFWLDDSQIFDGRATKFYAAKNGKPLIAVSIEEVRHA